MKTSKRKIDTWGLLFEGLAAEVKVYITAGDSETFFTAECAEPKFTARDTDINKLREKCQARFQEKVSIEWKQMLYVVVAGSDRTYMTGNGVFRDIRIKYEEMEIGQKPNGAYIRRSRGSYGDGETHVPDIGDINWSGGNNVNKATPGTFQSKNGTAAFIVDTPEHRAALDAIIAQLDAIRDQLTGILGQDNIAANLQKVNKAIAAGTPLALAAAAEKE